MWWCWSLSKKASLLFCVQYKTLFILHLMSRSFQALLNSSSGDSGHCIIFSGLIFTFLAAAVAPMLHRLPILRSASWESDRALFKAWTDFFCSFCKGAMLPIWEKTWNKHIIFNCEVNFPILYINIISLSSKPTWLTWFYKLHRPCFVSCTTKSRAFNAYENLDFGFCFIEPNFASKVLRLCNDDICPRHGSKLNNCFRKKLAEILVF